MATLEEAKAFLKKDAGDGSNLYDHLSEVLLKILVERPENLSDSFEHLSASIKQQRYVNQTQNIQDGTSKLVRTREEKWCNSALDLYKIKSEGEANENPSGTADLLDEANVFEWAGVGFSKSETFRLSLAVQRLGREYQTSSIRLWGKVLGLGADFYIAEGQLAVVDAVEDPLLEELGGANKFTYWAMKDDGSYEWIKLPNVRRDQILVARQLRRYVHADLDATVISHPPFPGVEKNYLRAQIARITSSTVVCPQGYFQENESGDIVAVEEAEAKTSLQLSDLAGWSHFSKELNEKYGRATPMPPKPDDGVWEGEEFASPLRTLTEDKADSWRVEKLPATLIPSVGEFAVAKSLIWPGAVGIAVGKKFLNVYVGHGVKFSSTSYQIPSPQLLQAGFGIGSKEDQEKSSLSFNSLSEQIDVLEDPNPSASED